jgi:hypothetical protein
VAPNPSLSFLLSVPHNSITLAFHIPHLSKLPPTSDKPNFGALDNFAALIYLHNHNVDLVPLIEFSNHKKNGIYDREMHNLVKIFKSIHHKL